MKLRITQDDLARLNKTQKANLRTLWKPERYQLAMATVCVNVETDEYADIEFCVGGVTVHPSGSISMRDLRAIDGYHRLDEDEDGFSEPVSFHKDQCLPLLSIGEMIEIMDNLHFRNFHFYLLAGTGVVGCEVGNFRSNIKEKILSEGFQQNELCDVLWKMIVAQV